MDNRAPGRYRDYNRYLRAIFGERVQKISLDAGLNCPNRDGTLSKKGCIFCDPRGSGTGQWTQRGISIPDQIVTAREYLRHRYRAKKFIAYFQSFSNTYAPLPTLKGLYDAALTPEDMVGLSVATRPDCVDLEILKLLESYKENHLVWLELGLQSAHNETLEKINRGHDVACFERAVHMAHELGLNICAHVILGLPGEDRRMMLETARFLADLPVHGIKVHVLYIVKGTTLAERNEKSPIRCLEREEYVDLLIDFLELTPPDRVVHRLTGDPPSSELVVPSWTAEKSKNLKRIQERLEERDTWQGKRWEAGKLKG